MIVFKENEFVDLRFIIRRIRIYEFILLIYDRFEKNVKMHVVMCCDCFQKAKVNSYMVAIVFKERESTDKVTA